MTSNVHNGLKFGKMSKKVVQIDRRGTLSFVLIKKVFQPLKTLLYPIPKDLNLVTD